MNPDEYQNKSVTDTAAALQDYARELMTLATFIETAQADPSKENAVQAEQASFAALRVVPGALRAVARLQNAAEDVVSAARDRRDQLMSRLYGADGNG